MAKLTENIIWELLRISLGGIFFWAFVDKLFGLGFATEKAKSWILGTSPTSGFLQFGTDGPLQSVFQSLSGNMVIDILFMAGLLLVGLSLLLGIGVKIAGYTGALMMLLIYLSAFPPENNPIVDEHIIYIIVLLGFTITLPGEKWGLGKWWKSRSIVKKHPLIR